MSTLGLTVTLSREAFPMTFNPGGCLKRTLPDL